MEASYPVPSKVRQLLSSLIESAGQLKGGKLYEVSVASLAYLFAGNTGALQGAVRSLMTEPFTVTAGEHKIIFPALQEFEERDGVLSFTFTAAMVRFYEDEPDLVMSVLSHNEPTLH